jgi:two-component system, NtrC family, nitrogen regulation sensor histidine kinase GlnL
MSQNPAPIAIWIALPVPAFVIDASDRIEAANPAAESFLNISERALRGQSVLSRLRVNMPMADALARVRTNTAPIFVNDVDVTVAGRAPVQCNIQIAPLGDLSQGILMLVSPREMADRLGRAQSSAVSARSAIGMADMLAHEIKNPLAGISGAAQLISMNASPEDQELTDLIVVEQFGNMRPPERKVVNIHDLLDRARRSALVGVAARMQVIADYDPSLPETLADGDQLLQVFLNLLKNASEAAGPKGGTIRIRTFYDLSLRLRRKDGTGTPLPLQIEIIDDGPGIKPEIAAEIFEPFVSGRENGTGLGLALVSRIISDHDSWINVDSVPGRTVFRISLPVAPKEVEDN